MRIVVLVLLLTLTVPAWAAPNDAGTTPPSPPVTVSGDGMIVPGQRVGALQLGMTMRQIVATMGPQYKRNEFKPEKIILYEWRNLGIWVSLDEADGRIRVISAFGANGKYHTVAGVRLLDPFSKAEKIYGKGYKRWEYPKEKITLIRYPDLGLQFGVVNDPRQLLLNGRIFQIGIFQLGDLPPVRQP